MAQNDLVGEQTQTGAEGNQPPVSHGEGTPITQNAAQPQNFVSKSDFDAVVKELRGLQSRQDKSQNEQTRFMDEIRGHMAKGLSLDEAEKAVNDDRKAREKDDLLYQIAQKVGVSVSPSQPATAGNGNGATADTAKVIQNLGLDGNDPEVVDKILGKTFQSEIELENAAMKIALSRVKSNPSLAAAPPVNGSPVADKTDTDALIAKLSTLQKTPTKNKEEIRKISAELDARGWK